MPNYGYTFKNFAGDLWRVAVMDTTEENGDLLALKPTEDGFTLNYEGGTEEPYREIITSTLAFSIYRDANSLALLDLLAYGDMNRCEVLLYKITGEYDETATLFWAGRPLLDALVKPDAPDNVGVINIQAVDGFGQLQDYEYTTYDVNALDTLLTLNEWFEIIFAKMPVTFVTGALWSNASVWYETRMPYDSSTDPMQITKIKQKAFVTVDEFGVYKGSSLYDILIYILTTHNLTVRFWGDYLFIQDNTFVQTTTRKWTYDSNADFVSTAIISLQDTMLQRLEGGSFTYVAPMKKVVAEYDYFEGIYENNLFPSVVEFDTAYELTLATAGETISLMGTLQTDYEPILELSGRIRVEYVIKITNGTHYLNGVLGENYWTTNAASVITLYSRGFNSDEITQLFTTFWIDTIPPEDGEPITFEVEFLRLVEEISYQLWTPGTITMSHTCVADSFTSFVSVSTDPPMEGTYKYQATVVETEKYDLELRKTILGDGPRPKCKGALRVNDSPALVAEKWVIYSEIGAEGMAINSLRCRETLALRRVVTQKINGTFYGTPNIQKGFVYNAQYYVFTQINWSANKNEFYFSAIALNYE